MARAESVGLQLDGRVAVVTGAAQGLGRVTADVLAELGARVVALDVDERGARATADELGRAGHEVLGLACDVADEGSVERAAAAVAERFGPSEILVNNAGIISWSPLEDLPLEEWERVMAVNLRGVFLCTKHFGRQMLAQGRGSIINISSVAGTAPESSAGAYTSTKAGVIGLTRQTAVEWGDRGVRCNAVSPGMMRTPMAERFLSVPAALDKRKRMTALGRIGEPREVAAVIAYLASDASSYVTAQNLEVDGGMMQMLIKLLPRPGVKGGAEP